MSTDPPAGYDPDTWEAAIEAMECIHDEFGFSDYADAMLRAALEVLGSGETAAKERQRIAGVLVQMGASYPEPGFLAPDTDVARRVLTAAAQIVRTMDDEAVTD